MKKVAVVFTRREHGVLSDVCRKYTQRDIVGEDANCLIQFDEMLAEISQQLEECSIDECPWGGMEGAILQLGTTCYTTA